MARVKIATLDTFQGVDRRRPITSSDPKTLYVGNNVEVTRGGTVRSAPIPRIEAELPVASVGLYAAGGKLRTIVPAGYDLEGTAPHNFVYDAVSRYGVDPDYGESITLRYTQLHASTTHGADAQGKPFPYVVLGTATGAVEHHYIDGTAQTRVELPFTPGKTLVKQSGKLFASNLGEGLVHFSSTEFGPREWRGEPGDRAENDAGFIDITRYASGDPRIRGLTFQGTQLVVFFQDAVQFWITDPDPANFQFHRSLVGPGTPYFGSVSPIIYDLYFFAQSGFHSIQAVSALGETEQGDIGAQVFDISKQFTDGTYDVHALWSQYRSQYLCFFVKDDATTVFIRTVSPLGGISAWTTWEFDFPVEYAVELGNKVYLRSDDTVYRLDDSGVGEALGFTATVETHMVDGGSPRRLKSWDSIDLSLQGTIDTLSYRSDPLDPTKTWVGARNIGYTAPGGLVPILGVSHNLGVVMSATKGFELSSIALQFTELQGAG